MPSLFSHCWRLLLIAALVLNPVAGASAAMAAGNAPAKPDVARADDTAMPPCHGMAMHHEASAKAPAQDSQARQQHGCDCGNPACQFGACCIVGAFDVPALRFVAIHYTGTQPVLFADADGTAAPPLARMMRPPIA